MRVSAKADYALRGVLEIAAARNPPVKRDEIAKAQRIPVKFLETILGELKHAGIIASQRGAEGGYSLAKDAAEVTVADVIRVIDGPLAHIRDTRPESLDYQGVAEPLKDVFVALRARMREVLESVTLADLVAREMPEEITSALSEPEAYQPH
ncbi:MAG: RrF2 family transcriptional regulator [Solirubrobacterales bacterium]